MDLPSAPPRAPTDSELTANDVRQIFLFTPNSLASEGHLEHVRREQLLAVGVVAAAQHDGLDGVRGGVRVRG